MKLLSPLPAIAGLICMGAAVVFFRGGSGPEQNAEALAIRPGDSASPLKNRPGAAGALSGREEKPAAEGRPPVKNSSPAQPFAAAAMEMSSLSSSPSMESSFKGSETEAVASSTGAVSTTADVSAGYVQPQRRDASGNWAKNRATDLPLVLYETPADLKLTPEQEQGLEKLAEDFLEKSGAGNPQQNPSDPQFAARWDREKMLANEQLRALIGWEAFNQLNDSLPRE